MGSLQDKWSKMHERKICVERRILAQLFEKNYEQACNNRDRESLMNQYAGGEKSADIIRQEGAGSSTQKKRNQSKEPRRAAKHAWREQREHQYCNCSGMHQPLLGRCVASPGGWSWERFAYLLAISLRAFRPDCCENLKNMRAGPPRILRKPNQSEGQQQRRPKRR